MPSDAASGGDTQPTGEEKLLVIVYSESASSVPSNVVGGHTSTLLGKIFKRRFPLEGMFSLQGAHTKKQTNRQTNRQKTDKQTNKIRNQIFVDSVGHI